MVGFGTLINFVAILAGGIAGLFLGNRFSQRMQDTVNKACGISVLFIGMAGAMEGMLSLENGSLSSGQSLLITLCLVLGALVGELINIEGWFERLGEWLKIKSGNAGDNRFLDGFLTASLTVCIGAMAIVGAIEDGMYGDFSILATKSILDLILVMIMACSLGVGCVFSAIPVAVLEGGITALARLIKPVMTPAALFNLSMVGSILIFCVGLNLVWGKKVRVANLLPAVVLAVLAAFLP